MVRREVIVLFFVLGLYNLTSCQGTEAMKDRYISKTFQRHWRRKVENIGNELALSLCFLGETNKQEFIISNSDTGF